MVDKRCNQRLNQHKKPVFTVINKLYKRKYKQES